MDFVQNFMVEWLAILLLIWKLLGSNLETTYSDRCFHVFSQSFLAYVGIIPQVLPSTSCSNNYPSVILTMNVTQPELLGIIK
jgi:hypothetical protein